MKKPRQLPSGKAKRRYNKLVDYCTENYWSSCEKCFYPKQCYKLTELGLSPGSGVKYDQNYPKGREEINRILGVSAKKLSEREAIK
jgi:hypothetical protein